MANEFKATTILVLLTAADQGWLPCLASPWNIFMCNLVWAQFTCAYYNGSWWTWPWIGSKIFTKHRPKGVKMAERKRMYHLVVIQGDHLRISWETKPCLQIVAEYFVQWYSCHNPGFHLWPKLVFLILSYSFGQCFVNVLQTIQHGLSPAQMKNA